MFEDYHGSGGSENGYRQPEPSQINQSMDAAYHSLHKAYHLYDRYRQHRQPDDQNTLKNQILTEVTFARTFYMKVQREVQDQPLVTAGFGPRVSQLEQRLDDFIGTLRSEGIVYEDMLLGSRNYEDPYRPRRF